MHEIRDHDSALAFLTARINYERSGSVPYRGNRLKLDRMACLLDKLGGPQNASPIIHLAGTKGKGSTAAMTASILRRAGFRTGLYTSPHLERVEERFVLDGVEIDQDLFVDLVREIAPAVAAMDADGAGPTYFEITTALAWMFFRGQCAECAVVEVGMGGRLDSTNVSRPELTAITTISKDHTRQLGDTLSAIAIEKAGIVKPNTPLVLGPLPAEALQAVLEIAADKQAPVFRLGVDFHAENIRTDVDQVRWSYRDGDRELLNAATRLLGRHQANNAAMAIMLASEFAKSRARILSDSAILEGLRNATCPARVEVIHRDPWFVLDAAHNEASASSLLETLRELPVTGRRTLIFATSRDKNYPVILELLGPHFDRIIMTRFLENPRAESPERLARAWNEAIAPAAKQVTVATAPSPLAAWKAALENTPQDGLVCVAGSFFLAAELRGSMQSDATARSD